MTPWHQINKVASINLRAVEARGWRVEHHSDFEYLREISRKHGRKLTPHFCPKENTFFRSEAFWVGVFDGDECIAHAAMKSLPVGEEGLIEFSRRYWARVYRRGSKNKIKFSDKQLSRLKEKKGNLIYGGEWFVSSELQKNGLGTSMGSYAICSAFAEWPAATEFFIFMRRSDVKRGLAASLEMLDQEIPHALEWASPPSQAETDYYFLGATRASFEDWLLSEIRRIEQS